MSVNVTLLPEWGEDKAWRLEYLHVNNLAVSFTLKSGDVSHNVAIHYGWSDEEVVRRVDLFEILGEIRTALLNDERDLVQQALSDELLQRATATTG